MLRHTIPPCSFAPSTLFQSQDLSRTGSPSKKSIFRDIVEVCNVIPRISRRLDKFQQRLELDFNNTLDEPGRKRDIKDN